MPPTKVASYDGSGGVRLKEKTQPKGSSMSPHAQTISNLDTAKKACSLLKKLDATTPPYPERKLRVNGKKIGVQPLGKHRRAKYYVAINLDATGNPVFVRRPTRPFAKAQRCYLSKMSKQETCALYEMVYRLERVL